MKFSGSHIVSLAKSVIAALYEIASGWSTPSFAVERHVLQRVLTEPSAGNFSSKSAARQMQILRDRLADSQNPPRVWFGPFVGEVGYELLYWRAYVQGVRDLLGLTSNQVGIISRGGVAGWYGVNSDSYVDLYKLIGQSALEKIQTDEYPVRFRSEHREIVRLVSGARRFWVHPRMLHQMIAEFKARPQSLEKLTATLMHVPITEEQMLASDSRLRAVWGDLLPRLPQRFIAVKVYGGSNLNNKKFSRVINSSLKAISEHLPVVGLSNAVSTTSHQDWIHADVEIFEPMKTIPAELNLGIQTLLIGRAQAFWGTYGGFSYLPMLLRTPTLSFKDGETHQKLAHEVMENHVKQVLGTRYEVLDLSVVDLEKSSRGFLESVKN